MPKREGWIKLDRRLIDHWKVRAMAKAVDLPRWCVVGGLAYLWGLAEDCGPCLGPHFDEVEHELPPGFMDAMVSVEWAYRDGESLCISTREENPKSIEMRRVAQARWSRSAEGVRAHPDRSAKRVRAHPDRSAREREENRLERQTESPPGDDVPASSAGGSLGPSDILRSLRG